MRVSSRQPANVIRPAAPQYHLDLRHQFTRVEGLRQIIIGAHFEAEHAVEQTTARTQHDNRNRAVAAQFPREIETVLAVQHQVEHDEVNARRIDDLLHLRAAFCGLRAVTHAAEVIEQELADVRIVVDDEYLVHVFLSSCRERYNAAAVCLIPRWA
jgi:hypothetical protein